MAEAVELIDEGARADRGRRRGLVPARHRRPAAAATSRPSSTPAPSATPSSATSSRPPAASRSTATGQHVRLRPKHGAKRHSPTRFRAGRACRLRWRRARAAAFGARPRLVLRATVGLPAALLLGPMVAGIAFSLAGAGIQLPALPFSFAQALVGCMIARILAHAGARRRSRADWPVFAARASPSVVAASAVLGWIVARLRILPGTTAVWGSSPGAAGAMTLMSASFGADMRLVAFMQYTRVVIVATLAAVVARFWADADAGRADRSPGSPRPTGPGSPRRWRSRPDRWPPGRSMRLPGGAAAPAAGARRRCCRTPGSSTIELPPLLLALAYGAIGWGVGLRFDRAVGRPRRPGAAGGARLDRRPRWRSAPASPPSSSSVAGIDPLDRLSRDEPRRRRHRGDHRLLDARRRGLRDGDADRAPPRAADHRPDPRRVLADRLTRSRRPGPRLGRRAARHVRPATALSRAPAGARISCSREAVRANSKAPSPSAIERVGLGGGRDRSAAPSPRRARRSA